MMLERLTCCPGWNIRGEISASEFTIQLFDGDERINAISLFCPGQMYQCFAPSIDASVNFIDFDGVVTYSPSKEQIIKMCEEMNRANTNN